MEYLVIFNPKAPPAPGDPSPEAAAALRAEQAPGRVLYGQGGLRQSWEIDTERRGAVCLFEADSVDHVRQMVESFPQVASGAVETQTVPLKPDGAYVEVE